MENYTNMTDAELKLIVDAVKQEQERRERIPEESRPDPEISRIMRERREALYGNPVATWYSKEAM